LTFQGVDDERLAELVAFAVRTPEPERSQRAPNAYTDRQVRRVLGFIRPTKAPSLATTHRLLNEFAFYVGFWVRTARPVKIESRVKLLKSVKKKAEGLLAELNNGELERESSTPKAALSTSRLGRSQRAVRRLIAHTDAHLRRLTDDIGGKGKAWDTELRRYHIHAAALLCAFLEPTFRPSRVNDEEEHGNFLPVVRELSEPLFDPDPPDARRQRTWRGMVRQYVDESNAAAKKQREHSASSP